jgi:hypothetical protein
MQETTWNQTRHDLQETNYPVAEFFPFLFQEAVTGDSEWQAQNSIEMETRNDYLCHVGR